MLKILGRKTSSNVQKVLWCCEELRIPFEREDVGGDFGKNHTPEYLALNPNGLVPTIIDNGFVLWESNAVVRYLASAHGHGTLYPADAKQRADADRWMDWQQTTVAPPMGILFRGLLKSPRDEIDAAQVDGARTKAGTVWSMMDTSLGDRPFVAGSELTVGDIALGNAVHRWFKLPIAHPDLPRLKAWYDRLCSRPAYAAHVASV